MKLSLFKGWQTKLHKLYRLLPDPFWLVLSLGGLAKVLIFLGLTTTWNNSWYFYFFVFYKLTNLMALFFTLSYFSLALLWKGRTRIWVTLFLSSLLAFILFANLLYYRGFENFLSVHLISQRSNLEDLGSTILSLIHINDLIFFIDIFIVLFILLINRKIGQGIGRNLPLFILILAISISSISYAHYRYDIVEKGQRYIVFRICWTPIDTMRNLSPIGYHLYDAYVYFKENRTIELTEEQEEIIANWYKNNQEVPPAGELQGIFAGHNLLLIQVESLENFLINLRIDGQEITPHLNSLLANSIYFPNFYEQVWTGTTSDAELLANTSLYPVRRGSTFFRYPQNTYNSLPLLLKERGYRTRASHADNPAYWNWVEALTEMGFDETLDSRDFVMDEKIGLGLSDESYLRQMVPIILETEEPFYDFVITMTSHGPFDLPPEKRELELPPELDQTKLGSYFQSLHYVDKQIGTFLAKLDEGGLLDNTLVVLYGDHGGIHKYYTSELDSLSIQEDWPLTKDDLLAWREDASKVPLLIYKKGMEPQVIETTGGQIDILPTIAYLLGIDYEEYSHTALGRNLLTTTRDYALLGNGTFRGKSEEWKEHAVQGMEVADWLIQSDYFAKRKK